jgi:hypothetical protein
MSHVLDSGRSSQTRLLGSAGLRLVFDISGDLGLKKWRKTVMGHVLDSGRSSQTRLLGSV